MIRALLIWLALALPVNGETIVAGLSQTQVQITADFSGEEILVYGAVRRETPLPAGSPLEVIITVEGPQAPLVVRKKDRVWGIWVNAEAVLIDRAPSFYAIATTAPLDRVLSATEDLRNKITIPRAIRAVGIASEAMDAPGFVDALIRLREKEGRYFLSEGAITLAEQTLFRADIALPSNLTEGSYRVRLFLTRDGQVVDAQERTIAVEKEGLERWVFNLSRDAPLAYGAVALLIALIAGWAASLLFRLFRA
jgi:uncharacterized protein (TIGR02186 family)